MVLLERSGSQHSRGSAASFMANGAKPPVGCAYPACEGRNSSCGNRYTRISVLMVIVIASEHISLFSTRSKQSWRFSAAPCFNFLRLTGAKRSRSRSRRTSPAERLATCVANEKRCCQAVGRRRLDAQLQCHGGQDSQLPSRWLTKF